LSSDNTTTTQQSAKTDPYAPTVPLLANEASTIGGISTAVTPAQQAAAAKLQGEANAIPDLGPQETGAVNNSLNANTTPQQGMLSGELANYMKNTNGVASNTDLNPMDTPGFSDALGVMGNDITKNFKSMYAGSGRDPTGAGSFTTNAGRGIAQAEAPVIAAQYNNNVSNLENANAGQAGVAGSTASGLTSEQMSALQQQLQGLAGGASLPGILTQPGQSAYEAANTAYGTPWSNLSPALAATEGVAGMGSTSSGQGSTDQQTSPLTNILGLLTGGMGLAGSIAKSDVRSKENIQPVGKAKGHNIYDFNYKDDPAKTPHRGVLAQEVEKVRPDAVHNLGGTKYVNYGKLGMLAA
jgi:Chaperone of endosialidase